jgi:hypothetical protein
MDHVLKAWWLCATKKIEDVEVQGAIPCDLHDMMYISMNHDEIIGAFKEHWRKKVQRNFNQHS